MNESWRNDMTNRTGSRASEKAKQSAMFIRDYCSNIKDCSHCCFDSDDCFCKLSSNIPKNWNV